MVYNRVGFEMFKCQHRFVRFVKLIMYHMFKGLKWKGMVRIGSCCCCALLCFFLFCFAPPFPESQWQTQPDKLWALQSQGSVIERPRHGCHLRIRTPNRTFFEISGSQQGPYHLSPSNRWCKRSHGFTCSMVWLGPRYLKTSVTLAASTLIKFLCKECWNCQNLWRKNGEYLGIIPCFFGPPTNKGSPKLLVNK